MSDEPQASTPQPEVSDEMVEAACAAFEQAQQWLVASARSYPVREVMRRALEAALAIRCEQDRPSDGEDGSTAGETRGGGGLGQGAVAMTDKKHPVGEEWVDPVFGPVRRIPKPTPWRMPAGNWLMKEKDQMAARRTFSERMAKTQSSE